MYMNYCKFEGTYSELRVCLNDVEEHVEEYAEYATSSEEIKWFKNLVELFHEFLCDQQIIDECGDLDREALDAVCEKMAKSYCEEEEE